MSQNYDFLRSFTIDGKDTKHLFQIAKLNIPFLSKENEFFQVGNTDGKNFRHTRLGDYTLSIDGFIIKDNTGKTVPQVMDELKALVNSDEPQKLVFDIFPDRYFNAIFTGAEEYDATDLKYTPLTLTFDVPDGLAHAIEPIGFSNTYSTTTNVMLDSEYTAINKYMKPWVQKLDEKFNNSNVVQGDFTNGIPLNFERDKNSDERWLNYNPATTIHTDELKVGDEVNFSVYAQVVSIDEENDKDYAGQVILEEWDTVNGAILKRHIVYIPKKVTTEFTEYGSVVKIENEKTNAINLQYGFRGSNLIKWSKPMVSFLPPIGETVTAPSVGAKAYSHSLDFGDYGYSGNPNLFVNTLKSSDFIKGSHGSLTDDNGMLYFTSDGTGDIAMFTRVNTPAIVSGKTYTISARLRFDEGTTGDINKLRLTYRKILGGDVLLEANNTSMTIDDVGKEITIKGTSNVAYQITNLERFYLSVSFSQNGKINGGFKLSHIKIEEGPTATPYQPKLLDEPYFFSKVALGENMADPKITFPIKASTFNLYIGDTKEELIIGQTYTITLKGTKPARQTFAAFNSWDVKFGELKPVEGLTDVWSLTFTPTKLVPDFPKNFRIYQSPEATAGTCQIDWLKIEKGDTRTPNIPYYKYEGIAPAPSNNPKDYHWGYSPSYYNAITYEPSTTGISDLLKVKNNGTYKTTPRFIFKTQGENGLVALAKDDGSVLQFGNTEEVDNVTNVVSQQVVSWDFYGSQLPANMEVNAPIGSSYPYFSNNPNTPNLIQGSWNMDLDVDSALPGWIPEETRAVWHGPTLRHAIPLDSAGNRNGEFSTHNRFRFYTPSQNHRGRIEYVISDDNVQNYLGFVLRDSATTNTTMFMECWYKGKLLKTIMISRKDFTKDFFEINMYRYKKSLHWRLVQVKGITNNNTVIIDKEVKFNYNLNEEDTTPIKYWGVWTERYSSSNYIRPFITDTQFRWISTPVVQNIRNYFQDGDIIEIDVKSRQILVNGVVNNELNVVGNQWEKFVLDIGETTIQPIVSSWANPAEVTCIVEESYL